MFPQCEYNIHMHCVHKQGFTQKCSLNVSIIYTCTVCKQGFTQKCFPQCEYNIHMHCAQTRLHLEVFPQCEYNIHMHCVQTRLYTEVSPQCEYNIHVYCVQTRLYSEETEITTFHKCDLPDSLRLVHLEQKQTKMAKKNSE